MKFTRVVVTICKIPNQTNLKKEKIQTGVFEINYCVSYISLGLSRVITTQFSKNTFLLPCNIVLEGKLINNPLVFTPTLLYIRGSL